MEFIKVGKNYMIKNSNGRIVSEKEKLELENKELTLTNADCACIDKIKKVSKNRKRIKEIEDLDKSREVKIKNYATKELKKELNEFIEKETALQDKENADETIKETDTTI